MVTVTTTNTSRKAIRDIRPEREQIPVWSHPEVLFWYDEWRLIRDAASGEKDVKDYCQAYAPPTEGMDDAEYAAYIDRATYYNFTGRTISALVGTLFKKDPKLEGVPARLDELVHHISQKGSDFTTFAVEAASEVFTLGRYGVLVDLPAEVTSTPEPYFAGYTAENIVDWGWEADRKTGRQKLTKVVLREYHLGLEPKGQVQRYFAAYRVLELNNGVYQQVFYKLDGADADITDAASARTVTPTVRGKTLPYIPFLFFGVTKNEPCIEKSPMLDIARINISHFKSYAHLEHGRYYTGLPIYYRETTGAEDEEEVVLGPSTLWNLSQGSKAGVIEFNGQGLKFLENALTQKENHAASLGGRMVGITAQSTAETDNQTELKNRNEQALLLNMSRVLDNGFTLLLRWWAWMAGVADADVKKITASFTKDFLLTGAGSREFRAVHSMYKDGVLPIEVLYDYFSKNEVIPDWLELEEFKTLLDSQDSFPNNPDFLARKEGFPNAQAKVTTETQEAAQELELELLDNEIAADKDAAKLAAETTKAVAKENAKAAAKAPKPAAGSGGAGVRPAAGKPPVK